jgi:hypothetical protein
MLTLEDITSKPNGASMLSILDITHAYWSLQLDKRLSMLTAFNTHFGKYRWLRLPFGISTSGDLFMQKISEILEGLSGVTAIVDDILVYGRTKEEHDKNLKHVLERAREKGVKLNPDK